MAEKDSTISPTEDAAHAISLGLGSVLEQGDELELHTHSGTKIRGVVEDLNVAALVLRDSEDRLYFVPFTSIDSAEIFERADEDDGAEKDPPAPDEADVVDPPSASARHMRAV